MGADPERDIKAFIAVREAVGDEAMLYVDANQGWPPDEAVRTVKKMEPYGLAYVEEPVKSWDFEGKLWVADRLELSRRYESSLLCNSNFGQEFFRPDMSETEFDWPKSLI